MSGWTQGLAERADLPPKFREWADRMGNERGWGKVQCLVWDAPGSFDLDYGERSLRLTRRPQTRGGKVSGA